MNEPDKKKLIERGKAIVRYCVLNTYFDFHYKKAPLKFKKMVFSDWTFAEFITAGEADLIKVPKADRKRYDSIRVQRKAKAKKLWNDLFSQFAPNLKKIENHVLSILESNNADDFVKFCHSRYLWAKAENSSQCQAKVAKKGYIQ